MLEIVKTIRDLLSRSWKVLVCFIPQGANVAVNVVTKLSRDHPLGLQLVRHPPPSIQLVVE